MIAIEEDVEEFLEHFGIKGMHWGQRKQKQSSNKRTKEGKKKFARNLAIGAVGGIAVGTGIGLAVRSLIQRNANFKIGSIKNYKDSVSVGKKYIAPTDAQMKEFRKSLMRKQIRKDVASKQAGLLRNINKDSRKHFDKMGTPFPEREFFDPSHWDKIVSTIK